MRECLAGFIQLARNLIKIILFSKRIEFLWQRQRFFFQRFFFISWFDCRWRCTQSHLPRARSTCVCAQWICCDCVGADFFNFFSPRRSRCAHILTYIHTYTSTCNRAGALCRRATFFCFRSILSRLVHTHTHSLPFAFFVVVAVLVHKALMKISCTCNFRAQSERVLNTCSNSTSCSCPTDTTATERAWGKNM